MWDFNPEENVSEKFKKFGDIKDSRGLRKFIKETVHASAGKQTHDLLGSVEIPLKVIYSFILSCSPDPSTNSETTNPYFYEILNLKEPILQVLHVYLLLCFVRNILIGHFFLDLVLIVLELVIGSGEQENFENLKIYIFAGYTFIWY